MLATSFDQWAWFVTIVVLLVIWLLFYIPMTGTRPERSRDWLAWSVYLTLAALASNLVLTWAVGQLL